MIATIKKNLMLAALLAISLVSLFAFNHKAYADEGMSVSYKGFFSKEGPKAGWSEEISDNTKVYFRSNYPSALQIGLVNQPAGMSGTVVYQVNSSGKGWLPAVENRAETGVADMGAQPLEAIKVWLNGDLAKNYDIYYKVLQNGQFGAWVKNGEVAGDFGQGTHISGFVISITKKGAGEPAESKQLPINQVQAKSSNIDPNKPMIAITYDDGPSSTVTPRIIAILEKNNAKATFFMVGSNVGKNASLVKKMADNGYELGNHTWAHKYLPKQSEAERRQALNMTNDAIQQASSVRPKLVRAPYGGVDRATYDTFSALGMPNVLWSIDTLDWKHKNAQMTIDAVLSKVKDGDIILMHDIHSATADASAVLIPELIKRGYQLVTVSELASYRGGLVAGKSYGSFRK